MWSCSVLASLLCQLEKYRTVKKHNPKSTFRTDALARYLPTSATQSVARCAKLTNHVSAHTFVTKLNRPKAASRLVLRILSTEATYILALVRRGVYICAPGVRSFASLGLGSLLG